MISLFSFSNLSTQSFSQGKAFGEVWAPKSRQIAGHDYMHLTATTVDGTGVRTTTIASIDAVRNYSNQAKNLAAEATQSGYLSKGFRDIIKGIQEGEKKTRE